MAEVQVSGPLVGQNFTDEMWRAIFGGEAGIVGNTDGTAYSINLPPSGNDVELGSATIDSCSVVGGFGHVVPAGTVQSVTIPESSNDTEGRTDLIVARLDSSAYNVPPGPVRLGRVPGVEGSLVIPAVDGGPPGIEELPLFAIRRIAGQPLASSTITDLRTSVGPNLYLTDNAPLPANAPLGTRARKTGDVFARVMVGGVPTWVNEYSTPVTLTSINATSSSGPSWERQTESYLVRQGKLRQLHYVVHRTGGNISATTNGGFDDMLIGVLHTQDRPRGASGSFIMSASGILLDNSGGTWNASCIISWSGSMYLCATNPNVTFGGGSPSNTLTLDATWFVE